jgi:hypothetical protein
MDINYKQPNINRTDVPKELKDWKIDYPEYNPISFTSMSVLSNRLSDINSIGEV